MDDSSIETEFSSSFSLDKHGNVRGKLTAKFRASIRNYTGEYIGHKQQLSGITFN